MIASANSRHGSGPSPRVRGKHDCLRANSRHGSGPSPRVRGKRAPGFGRKHSVGSIPARAGETTVLTMARPKARVHPRACGGNPNVSGRAQSSHGPSPRVRGKHHGPKRPSQHPHGPSPRVRGKRKSRSAFVRSDQVHPRACGGNDIAYIGKTGDQGPSPRVRGKPGVGALGTPAARVHPRACGGNI